MKFAPISVPGHRDDPRLFHGVGYRWNWTSAQDTNVCSGSGPNKKLYVLISAREVII